MIRFALLLTALFPLLYYAKSNIVKKHLSGLEVKRHSGNKNGLVVDFYSFRVPKSKMFGDWQNVLNLHVGKHARVCNNSEPFYQNREFAKLSLEDIKQLLIEYYSK